MLDAAVAALAQAGLGDDLVSTREAGDEERLARAAVADGVETLVVLGGDGTWSHAARGVVEAGGGDRCRVAFLAAGTGNDLAKSLGVPAADYPAMARLIVAGRERRLDAARANGRLLFNSIGFGFDAAVLERTTRPGRLRGQMVYVVAALRELFRYPGTDVASDGGVPARRLMVIVANGRFLGGAFEIAPGAAIDDGALDLIAIGNAGAWSRLRLFAGAMRGRHIGREGVEQHRGPRFALHFREPPLAQVDGELVHMADREVVIESVPGALRVVA